MQTYDAAVVLGSAYNFEKQRYPAHMYESLRAAAGAYTVGYAAAIVVCGAAAKKALERGRHAPTTEAAEMERYLVAVLGVPKRAVFTEEKSTNTIENFINLRAIAARENWSRLFMPIAEPRLARAAFLGQKICHDQCDIVPEGVASDESFPTEAKLFGDAVCTLQDMRWGDHRFLLHADGSSRWSELQISHHECPFYVSTDAVAAGTAEQYRNFHPVELMDAYSSFRNAM